MYLYHLTPYKNMGSVMCHGLNPAKSCDGLVYFASSGEDALKLMCLRMYAQGGKWLLIKAEVDDSLVEESFDHSSVYFEGIRAFAVRVPVYNIIWEECKTYDLGKEVC